MTRPELWLFDLDGCLVDSLAGEHLRPYARELLELLRSLHQSVEIWSAGGDDYAERVALRVGIRELIDAFSTKDRGPDGKWVLPPQATAGDRTVVCVDDQPEGLPSGVAQIAVFPYIGPNVHDVALVPIIERVKASA